MNCTQVKYLDSNRKTTSRRFNELVSQMPVQQAINEYKQATLKEWNDLSRNDKSDTFDLTFFDRTSALNAIRNHPDLRPNYIHKDGSSYHIVRFIHPNVDIDAVSFNDSISYKERGYTYTRPNLGVVSQSDLKKLKGTYTLDDEGYSLDALPMDDEFTWIDDDPTDMFKDTVLVEDANDVSPDEDVFDFMNVGVKKTTNKSVFKPVSDVYREQAKYHSDMIAKLKNNLLNTLSLTEKKKINQQISRHKIHIQNISAKVEDIAKVRALEDIEKYATDQLNIVKDILSRKNASGQKAISSDEIELAIKIVDLWSVAGDFSGNRDHLFYNKSQLKGAMNSTMKKVTDKFTQWKLIADEYGRTLLDIQEQHLDKQVKKAFGNDVSIDFDSAIKDINAMTSNFMDISNLKSPILQAMYTWNKEANFAAYSQATEISKHVDKLMKKIMPTLRKYKKDGRLFDIFLQTQSNSDKRLTGNLVDMFSQKYYEDRKKSRITGRITQGKIKAQVEWLRNNEDLFDVRILFPDSSLYDIKSNFDRVYSEEEKNKLIDKLKKNLGEEEFNIRYEKAKSLIEEYKMELEAKRDLLEASGLEQHLIEASIEQWEKSHSPYHIAKYFERGFFASKINSKHIVPSYSKVVKVPKRSIAGKETGYYDSKYDTISGDKDLKEFYDYMTGVFNEIKQYLPNSTTKYMQPNILPELRKEIMAMFIQDGTSESLRSIWDQLKEATTAPIGTNVISQYINPKTGEIDKSIQVQFLKDHRSEIKKYIELKTLEFKNENDNKNPSEANLSEWKKEIMEKIASNKSTDLGKVVKAFALMGLSVAHKSNIEAQMKIAQRVFYNYKEAHISNSGDQMTDQYNKAQAKKGLDQYKKMIDHFMNSFYGYSTHDLEGKGTKKQYFDVDAELKKKIDNLLAENERKLQEGTIGEKEYNGTKTTLEGYLAGMGNVGVWSKKGDQLLKYVQLRSMGWNLWSGIANMNFGFIANMIEAGDGRIYNQRMIMKAYGLVLNSIVKSGTLEFVATDNAKKIRILMEKFDVLKASKDELYKTTKAKNTYNEAIERLKIVTPYQSQSRTEYINQATTMIATLMGTKITKDDGTVGNMWDAYDSNGELKGDYRSNDNLKSYEGDFMTVGENVGIKKVKVRIDKMIKKVHGNYDPDSPIMIKKIFLGRALSQFRTWMFEGFYDRFGAESEDFILDIKRKGRYRTGIAFIAYAKQTEQMDMSRLRQTIFTAKQLLRKLAWQKTRFDEAGFTEQDAANLRKNLNEIIIFMAVTLISLAARAMMDDDDKKNEFAWNQIFNFTVNQFNRLEIDLLFYVSPVEFKKLNKNIVPIFTLVDDAYELIEATWRTINGDPTIKSGLDKDMGRIERSVYKVLPFSNQVMKFRRNISTTY